MLGVIQDLSYKEISEIEDLIAEFNHIFPKKKLPNKKLLTL